MLNRFAARCRGAVLMALSVSLALPGHAGALSIRLCMPELSGSLDKQLIRRVIKAHKNELRACYEAGLLRQPVLQGRVVLQLQLDRFGRVTALQISGPPSFEKPPLDVLPCMAAAVSAWRFPAVRTSRDAITEVRYPITFRTSEPPPAEVPEPFVNPYFSDEELAAMSGP